MFASINTMPLRRACAAALILGSAVLMTSCETWGTDTRDHTVSYSQLPADVQRTIDARLNGGTVQRIEMKQQDGETVYAVHGFGSNGAVAFTVAQSGRFISWDTVNTAERSSEYNNGNGTGSSSNPSR